MREIKFRAWLKYEDVMVRVTEINMWGDDQNSHNIECENIFKDEILDYPRSEIKLMQYTGLKDMNGKEIYEGDVVKAESPCIGGRDFTGVVKFDECSFWIDNGCDAIHLFSETDIRIVVGNIYENPELLKV